MIQEHQIRVLPEQAANEQNIKLFISKDKGLDASLQYTDGLDGTCIDSFVLTDEQLDALLIGRLFGQNSDLIFLYHCFIRIKHGRLLLLSVRG